MDFAFDPRSFISLRADLAARIGAPVAALAILDSDSNITAIDSGMASLIDAEADEAIGRSQKWLLGKLGLAKKLEASELMANPQSLANGQEATMILTAEGLAMCVTGEATSLIMEAASPTRQEEVETPIFTSPTPVTTPPQVTGADITDLSVSLGACAGIDDVRMVIETLAPQVVPGSTGSVAVVHGRQALIVAHWGGVDQPQAFDASSCVAMRLGREFPTTNERVPLQCKHGSSLCIPVFSDGAIVAIVSFAGIYSREAAQRFSSALAPHARLLS